MNKPLIKITLDQCKTEYPKVYDAWRNRLEQLAQKGPGSIRIPHENKWIEVAV